MTDIDWKARAEKAEAERDEARQELGTWRANYNIILGLHDAIEAEASDLKAQVVLIAEAAAVAHNHIDVAMGDTDPADENDPLLLAAQALAPFVGDDSSIPAAARAYSEERRRLVERVKELEGTTATEYAARGSHPETALEKELGDEFARIAKQGPTDGIISRSAYAAIELVKKRIGVRTPGTVEFCKKCRLEESRFVIGDIHSPYYMWKNCTAKDCPIRTPGNAQEHGG